MYNFMIYLFLDGCYIGCLSWLYVSMLVKPGHILSFIPSIISLLQSGKVGPVESVGFWGLIAKPLFQCAVCNAGWTAIFYYLFTFNGFDFKELFVTFTAAMITAAILSQRLR